VGEFVTKSERKLTVLDFVDSKRGHLLEHACPPSVIRHAFKTQHLHQLARHNNCFCFDDFIRELLLSCSGAGLGKSAEDVGVAYQIRR
jgi:hypothetical protein